LEGANLETIRWNYNDCRHPPLSKFCIQ